jgi:zinc protease
MRQIKQNTRKGFVFFYLYFFVFCLSAIEPQSIPRLPFPLTSYQLENGLQVILSEDPSLPLVTVAVGYRAGPIDDQEGKSGLAYLLEGLMFSGSANVGRMQQYSFIQRVGGRLNAVTERDRTLYYQIVSSNHLATVLWMESDRMLSLALTTPNIERAKISMIEELNNLKRTNPYREGEDLFNRMIYPDFFYNSPIRGRSDELREISTEDVRNFYRIYYLPNKAVLFIVGNIDLNKTRELVNRYFRSIPKGPPVPERPAPSTRAPVAMNDSIESSLASSPGFMLGYIAPPPRSGDFYALRLVEYILFRGNSSRLYNKLVKKDRVASQLEGRIEVRGEQAILRIFVLNNNEFMK